MSILDNLPHSYTASKRTRTIDSLGGSSDSYTQVASGTCWHQQAGDSEINEFAKRGINITGKVYFVSDPGLNESHTITVNGQTYDVISSPEKDASAGLGVLWRINVNRSTSG